jgi:hypothetical protein
VAANFLKIYRKAAVLRALLLSNVSSGDEIEFEGIVDRG